MFSPKKVFLSIFSIIIGLFLIYTSYIFIQNVSNFESPEFQNTDKEDGKEYIIENKAGKLDEISKEADANDLVITHLSNIDNIISYGKNLDQIVDNKIKLNNGNFLVNIKNITKKYEVEGEGFNIKNNGPSSFYIDSSGDNDEKETYIISLDNILEVGLITPENGEIVNTIYLYPNEYIKFKPLLNKILTDSDVLRVNQVTSLDVLNSEILNESEINETFENELIVGDNNKKEKIKNMFLYLPQMETKQKNILEEFIDKKVITISGEEFIKDVIFGVDLSKLLLNPKKKKIYYKNKILKELIDILNFNFTTNSSEINEKEKLEIGKIYSDLEENLNSLKKYSNDDYENLKSVVIYYFELLIEGDSIINKKIEISTFKDKLDGKTTSFDETYLIKLYNFYQEYNYGEGDDLYLNIGDFMDSYIENGISEEEKGYFIDYLGKFILEAFKELNNGKDINFKYLINIINIYSNISLDYYQANNIKDTNEQKTLIQSGISNYITLLRELAIRIRKNFFEFQLSDTNILVKNENNFKITQEEINNLEKTSNTLNEFIDKNKDILENTTINKIKLEQNEKIKDALKIYFEAIGDYDTYVATHEEKNKDFISDNVNLEKIIKLDKEDALEYLSQFNYVNLDNVEVNIRSTKYCYDPNVSNISDINEDEYCYEVKNLLIGNEKEISFLLFPYEENKIENIVIKGDKEDDINEGSYPLDLIRDNFNSYNQDLDENYKFEDFFYFVFIANVVYEAKENFVFEETESEDPFIRNVKNSLLLGKGGSFDAIKNYLTIEYDDIILTEQENKDYKINIKNADVEYEGLKGEFNSEYLFKNGEVSSFKNPEIKFTSPLNGITINFSGIFNLDNKDNSSNFENVLERLTKTENENILINELSSLVSNLQTLTSKSAEIYIKYNYMSDSFTIKLNEYNINIFAKGDVLTKIMYNGTNILTKSDKMDNLSIYFNK